MRDRTNPLFVLAEGRHWIGFYKRNKWTDLLWFDSMGESIEFYGEFFTDFVSRVNSPVIESKIIVQPLLSASCGHFVLFFLYKCSRGCSMKEIMFTFSPNLSMNDRCVVKFVSSLKCSGGCPPQYFGKKIQCCTKRLL